MPKVVLRTFGGMLPIMDDRLLPDNNSADALNSWVYTGMLEGFHEPIEVHKLDNPNARTVFRIPKGAVSVEAIKASYWLEFENVNTTVVRSPVTEQGDPRYYWADGVHPPGYTTRARVEAQLPPLVLGIPRPLTPPVVTDPPSGGSSTILEDRTYVYTWVSLYAEEGPPSLPSNLVQGKSDATWTITLTAPTADDLANRALTHTNVYRTVTAADGTADYYFVEQIPISQLIYSDDIATVDLGLFRPLPSTDWTGPPEDLKGLCSLPNGMIAGWRGQELWYCEPFRPHAWPALYQTSVDFDIKGMAAIDQLLVIGTLNVAYTATGVHPASITLRIVTGSEPCLAQGSFVVTPTGVVYAGPNGLMMCNSGGVQNITRDFISTDKWHQLLFLNELNAALMNGAYYCYSGVVDPAFQANAFQRNAFQIDVGSVPNGGALIDLMDRRVGFTRLQGDMPTYKVLQDVWTAEVLLVRGGSVYLHSLVQGTRDDYAWRSKLFQLPKPDNYSCMKIVTSPANTGGALPFGTIEYYANDVLRLARPIPPNKPFRLPSGYKAQTFQVRVAGNLAIDQIEIATSMTELSQV